MNQQELTKYKVYEEKNIDPREFTDTAFLLGDQSSLAQAIFEKCLSSSPLIDNNRCARRTYLTIAVVSSLVVNGTFVPVPMRLPAGPLFAIANFIGFFKADVWIIRGTIKQLWRPKGRWEIILLQQESKGKYYFIAIIVVAITVSILAQLPSALPAFDYNGWFAVPSFIFSLIGGTIVPLRSIQLSIDRVIRLPRCRVDVAKAELEKLRKAVISLVHDHRETFRKMGYSVKLAHVSKLGRLGDTELRKVNDYFHSITDEPLNAPVVPKSSFKRNFAIVAGIWITTSLETTLATYTFKKTKESLIDNDVVASIFAGAVVASGVYLMGQSIINTTERIFNTVLNLVRCRREISVAEQLRPKLALFFKLTGLIIDSLALGATFVILGDFYDEIAIRTYFEVTLCSAYFLYLFTATLDLVDEALEEIVLQRGTLAEKQIIEFHRGLVNLQQLLEDSSLTDVGYFIAQLPAELKNKLADRVNLKIDALERYI